MSVHDDISNPLNQLVANPDEKKLRSEQAINLVLLSLQAPMCEFFFLVVDVINTVNFKRRLFHRHILINEMFELKTHSSVVAVHRSASFSIEFDFVGRLTRNQTFYVHQNIIMQKKRTHHKKCFEKSGHRPNRGVCKLHNPFASKWPDPKK